MEHLNRVQMHLLGEQVFVYLRPSHPRILSDMRVAVLASISMISHSIIRHTFILGNIRPLFRVQHSHAGHLLRVNRMQKMLDLRLQGTSVHHSPKLEWVDTHRQSPI